MLKILFTSFLTVVSFFSLYGQTADSLKQQRERGKQVCFSKDQDKRLLYVILVDNKKLEVLEKMNDTGTSIRELIDPNLLKSINVSKRKEDTEKYGSRGENGVVIIELKEGSFDELAAELREKFTDM